jgi:hypothetical protein
MLMSLVPSQHCGECGAIDLAKRPELVEQRRASDGKTSLELIL